MRDGCASCGSHPVGPPLARPAHELPSYARALFVCAAGIALAIAFLVATVSALFERDVFAFDSSALLCAAETAAWRLKWLALPFSLCAAWIGARACVVIRRAPSRFTGLRPARVGFALTLIVAVALSTLIAITIPERLRMRELARRAGENAQLYAGAQALDKYRAQFGTYPASISDLRRLDDPDCSIARVVAVMSPGKYAPNTDLASLTTGRTKTRGGEARRINAVLRTRGATSSTRNTDDLSGAGFTLTNYELALPGRDNILGTPDDLLIRDGMIVEPSTNATPQPISSNSNTKNKAARF